MADIKIIVPTGREGPGAVPYGMNPDAENVAVVPVHGSAHFRIPLPRRTSYLHVQLRQAGDFRAELKAGTKFVNATHRDLAEAIAAACAKVSA